MDCAEESKYGEERKVEAHCRSSASSRGLVRCLFSPVTTPQAIVPIVSEEIAKSGPVNMLDLL